MHRFTLGLFLVFFAVAFVSTASTNKDKSSSEESLEGQEHVDIQVGNETFPAHGNQTFFKYEKTVESSCEKTLQVLANVLLKVRRMAIRLDKVVKKRQQMEDST